MSQSEITTRRVVITGVGLVCPLGDTVEALWEAVLHGRSAVGPLRSLPAEDLPVRFGAEAWGFQGQAEEFGVSDKLALRSLRKSLKVMCREIQMGLAAAQRALLHAGLGPEKRDPDRTGVVYGSDYIMTAPEEFTSAIRACLNGQGQFEFSEWATKGIGLVDPLWLLKYLPNMPASHIAILNDLRGPNNSLTVREASSNLAVAEAFATIRRGHAEVMIAGATGSRVHPLRTVHVLLQEPLAQGDDPAQLSRPFDVERTGMVVGEGAAAIVLEELQSAQQRGAAIYGELLGYGSSAVAPQKGGDGRRQAVCNAIRQALENSGLSPGDIGHVHAHGLATVDSDIAEAEALAEVFSPRAVPVTALKSYCGNLGAGGGLVELIASLWSLREGRSIPVLNHRHTDPRCPVRVVTEPGVDPGRVVLNVNFTPQGQASAVIVRRWEG
ncbi:MAG: 3-oxoacyl-ACP synthase [Pirellulaceae bacterium]|nr:MAG: 3-oxoacyl-ACP synthase [Pirellulaceae bacterium]